MKSGLQAREGLHLKRLFKCPRDPRTERSVQFNLLSLGNRAEKENAPSGKKGGLAQLVERLLCKQNVIGSNPVTSTIW